jgi:ATPase subunit of ABC transporter with duplicated ATPase domains
METRWKKFERSGKFENSKKEREIFKELFIAHGKQFFDNCGKVVAFLEAQGTGKTGDEGKIHSPMVWIKGHWETNWTRYQNGLAKEQALKEAQAKKVEKDARKQAEEKKREEESEREKQKTLEWESKMEAATQRFLKVYQSENEVSTFAENVIQHFGCIYTRNSWSSQGWKSSLVKTFVISHFLKLEAQNSLTQSSHNTAEATA